MATSTQTRPIYTTLSRLYPSIRLPTSPILFYSFSLSRPTPIKFLRIISPPLLPSTESLRRLHLYSLLRPFSSPSAPGHQLVALFAAPSFKGDARDTTRAPLCGSRPSPRHLSTCPRVFPPPHCQGLRRSDPGHAPPLLSHAFRSQRGSLARATLQNLGVKTSPSSVSPEPETWP